MGTRHGFLWFLPVMMGGGRADLLCAALRARRTAAPSWGRILLLVLLGFIRSAVLPRAALGGALFLAGGCWRGQGGELARRRADDRLGGGHAGDGARGADGTPGDGFRIRLTLDVLATERRNCAMRPSACGCRRARCRREHGRAAW